MAKTVDKKVWDFAFEWLECDSEDGKRPSTAATQSLASDIQDAIENWKREQYERAQDEAYERAAARARGNDFERTGGKDWT